MNIFYFNRFKITSLTSLTFSTTSTSLTDVTNLSQSWEVKPGKGVLIALWNNASFDDELAFLTGSAAASRYFELAFLRDSTEISRQRIQQYNAVATQTWKYAQNSFWALDFPVPGTYTYKLKGLVSAASCTLQVTRCRLLVADF